MPGDDGATGGPGDTGGSGGHSYNTMAGFYSEISASNSPSYSNGSGGAHPMAGHYWSLEGFYVDHWGNIYGPGGQLEGGPTFDAMMNAIQTFQAFQKAVELNYMAYGLDPKPDYILEQAPLGLIESLKAKAWSDYGRFKRGPELDALNPFTTTTTRFNLAMEYGYYGVVAGLAARGFYEEFVLTTAPDEMLNVYAYFNSVVSGQEYTHAWGAVLGNSINYLLNKAGYMP